MPGQNAASARVLLINPNRMRPPIAPLGLEMIAASLVRRGFQVQLLDLAWERAPRKAIARTIKSRPPDAIGLSVRNLDDCYFASRAFLLPPLKRYVREVKRLSPAPVILGGVGFSISPRAALEYLGADFGIRGEGEDSLPRLLDQLLAGEKNPSVPGLVRPGGPEPKPARVRLEGRPAPERGRFDLERYFRLGGQGSIETQRGCNRNCIYCADPVAKGRTITRRDPESAVEELERLLRLGVHTLHWCDSEINLSRGHLEAVCRAVIRAGLGGKVKWFAYALPAPMDRELARLLARAGCAGIDFSVDAADANMLSGLGRDFKVEDLERTAAACKAAGIPFMFDLLLGGPGETRQTLKNTVSRIKKIKPDRVGVSFGMRVFAGTEMERRLRGRGPLEDNPCLFGAKRNNPGLIKPLFFVSDRMGKDPEKYLKQLIGDDPRFFFASREDLDRNYNYNDNRPLCRAIRKGARGAYWDILRRQAEA